MLERAVPSLALTVLGRVDREVLSDASTRAHFVLGVGDVQQLGSARELCDAVVEKSEDVSRFSERAREFDRRRIAHLLPPDMAPVIEPWSPLWAETATRVGARVLAAFDGRPASVDHIGSTSVPGLPAKEIIDLQVAVAHLVDCDSVDTRLRDAGFVNVQAVVPDAPGVRSDNARGDGWTDADGAKRIYASADAGQRVIVHVRKAGAANWRYALLFRDWLRASPRPCEEYAALKTKLAAAHGADAHFDDYARAKDHWFDRAHADMEEWAQSTGWSPASLAEVER
ncbi:GrpB family protein [Microbacterium maritypicum]|uniref:GrpB family protein n=1 Tax=Microbacterium TaxID=33882 RepID=UPI0025FD1A21|nr:MULTISPECIES: GrpB family protein [Microbacterium]